MSYWCRECVARLAALALLGCGGTAGAAEYYFQPQAEIGIEEDSNRNLVSSGDTVDRKSSSAGYLTDASGTWGIATPLSDTTIRPLVKYTDFPQLDTDTLRTALDLNSQFHSERSQAGLEAQFDRQSTYSSELANPQFNEINPNLPTTPETGKVTSNTTRTLVTAVPTYTYDLSPRLNWGVTGTYQTIDYTGSNAVDYIPYNYYLGGTSLTWLVSPRFDAAVGVFSSRESARNGSGSVDADGANVTFSFRWTTQFTSRLQISGERDDSQVVKPFPSKNIATGTGATYISSWQGQLGKLQLSVGRTFTPSGAGGTFRADQAQIEYDRKLTQRLSLTAAARVINYTAVTGFYSDSNYDYVNATAGLKWQMTRTWYISGGTEYLRAHYEPPVGSAANVMVYAAVGYQGLGKPQ